VSDDPFAKYAKPAAPSADDPFARYGARTDENTQSADAHKFEPSFEMPFEKTMRGVARAIVPPVVNFLDYPIRAPAADIVGAVKGGMPFDDKSRKSFYREREKSLEGTKIKETPGGEAISSVLGFPGQVVGGAVKGASEAMFGEGSTKAMGPFATVAGDVAPLALAGAKIATPSKTASVRPEAKAAIAAGYRLPPGEIPPLGEKPSLLSRTLGSESGKIKTQQAASTANQINTNSIAAQDIGLHPKTTLTDHAFEQAMRPAADVYNALPTIAPEIVLADSATRGAVNRIGGRGSLVEKFFPSAKANPGIEAVRQEMLANSSIPTSVGIKMISDYRHQAGANLKAPGDAQRHALGLAQREAANVLENAIERSIAYGPDAVKAFAVHDGAKAAVDAAKATIDGIEKRNVANGLPKAAGTGDAYAKLTDAETAARTASDELNSRLAARTPADAARATVELDKFRAARKLFAKVYSVRDATNLTTGNVSAGGLARIYNKKAPLTDGLKTIADAYNTAPKAMQVPEVFGHAEDWSVLDFFGTTASLAAGHPAVAAGIIGRPVARSVLL